MGQDKGLMGFEKKPLIIHILETLQDVVDEITVVFRDNKQLNSYKKHINTYLSPHQNHIPFLRYAVDFEKDQGPLVGLLTGLSFIKTDGALVLPCDSPFVSQQFIKNIFNINEKHRPGENNHDIEFLAIIPTWPDGSLEPLHAYYHKDCIPFIKKQLKAGSKDVRSVLKTMNVNYVKVEVLDPEKISFANLNRPEDIKSVNSHSKD
ncbi:molybdopterin-guanine dinucleotide biosynthesis protein A [Methanobacterium petrolearium]|nr:molybdopterin-guanine dinucleotide biosynthesis protein A [Methanobacterium petrolearium]BDZ71539.1 molybdenum cofactor guanylyltransferase [Methanobacterium petrolearium]